MAPGMRDLIGVNALLCQVISTHDYDRIIVVPAQLSDAFPGSCR